MRVQYLSLDDVLRLHHALVSMFATGHDPIVPAGPRDVNLVASAVSRPSTSLGESDKYVTVEAKAASLFHSLVKNHAFHNGNKRTALFAMLAFLARNGRRVINDIPDDDLFNMVLGIATGDFPAPSLTSDAIVDGLALWIRDRTTTVRARARTMRARDFAAKCASAGMRVKEDRQGWQITGNHGTIKIGNHHRELKGNVVRIYLQNLGLTEGDKGVSVDSFQDGVSDEQEILHRYQALLHRLAHA